MKRQFAVDLADHCRVAGLGPVVAQLVDFGLVDPDLDLVAGLVPVLANRHWRQFYL